MIRNRLIHLLGEPESIAGEKMTIKKMAIRDTGIGSVSKDVSEATVKKLAKRIRAGKWYLPPVVNERTGNVIGSTAVLFAFTALGRKEVFVIAVDMSPKEELTADFSFYV